MSNILFTLAENEPATTHNHFAVRYQVDENDCYFFADALKELGHTVYFANWKDLSPIGFRRLFNDNEKCFVDADSIPPLEAIELAFVYKMEGFLFDLSRFQEMVSLFESRCKIVINHPDTIRHNIDKRYLWELEHSGISVPATYLVNDDAVRRALAANKKMVLKPMRAERGYGAYLAQSADDLKHVYGKESEYLAQEYLPSIRQGEHSLVFLGFEFQHAVLKMPSPSNKDEFRCNESLGGTVRVYHPPDEEIQFAENVLCAYAKLGYQVHFSRIDYVKEPERGPVLIEAELLNPSIYANYSQCGKQFGNAIASYFDNLLKVPACVSC